MSNMWWWITSLPWSAVVTMCRPIVQVAGGYFNGCGPVF